MSLVSWRQGYRSNSSRFRIHVPEMNQVVAAPTHEASWSRITLLAWDIPRQSMSHVVSHDIPSVHHPQRGISSDRIRFEQISGHLYIHDLLVLVPNQIIPRVRLQVFPGSMTICRALIRVKAPRLHLQPASSLLSHTNQRPRTPR